MEGRTRMDDRYIACGLKAAFSEAENEFDNRIGDRSSKERIMDAFRVMESTLVDMQTYRAQGVPLSYTYINAAEKNVAKTKEAMEVGK